MIINNQYDIIDYVPVGEKNAVTNYELALTLDMKVCCINRMLNKLVKYNFICEKQSNKHYKSKLYYRKNDKE